MELTDMKKLFPIILLSLMLAGCRSGKQAALNDLRSLTAEIEQNATVFNFNEWLKEQKKFEKISKRIEKYEYSEAENHEIGELKGQCVGYFAKGVLGKASNKLLDAANQIQGIIDGVKKVLMP